LKDCGGNVDNQKILYVVTAGTDSSFSNRMLRMIRNEEEEHPEETLPGGIRLIILSEDQWIIQNWLFPKDAHFLFVGNVALMRALPGKIETKFEKYGIRYGWGGHNACLVANEKALSERENYEKFLEDLRHECRLAEIVKSPKRMDILQFIIMLCVALIVPFGSVLVGGKLVKDWFENTGYVKKQQYFYGILHLYKHNLKDFMETREE